MVEENTLPIIPQTDLKNPSLTRASLIFSSLGLATPVFFYICSRLIMGLPCCGETSSPADGIGWLLVTAGGIAWWTLMEILSIGFLIAGSGRGEKGEIRVFATMFSILSLCLISAIYIFVFWFIYHLGQRKF
ncbi:MAG: hypothetical protein K1X72_07275 [Pyrinomonadaceae bacterium]|nr:hypothetical protein [Pyrinomonadaceae bacterium]